MEQSAAQLLFGGKQILTKRPEGMTYEEYRGLRFIQTKLTTRMFSSKPSRAIAQLTPIRLGYNYHP